VRSDEESFEHLKRPTTISPDQVLAALSQVLEPEVNRDIVSLGMVKNIQARDGQVRFTVQLRRRQPTAGSYRAASAALRAGHPRCERGQHHL
jgi:hypothetical protein